jgi:hypothetical protein
VQIVIIGGSDAGISAAVRIRELNPTIYPTAILPTAIPTIASVTCPSSIKAR